MIHITVFHREVEAFKKQWPMCGVVKSDSYFTTFAMQQRLYEKVYLHVKQYGSISATPVINCIKITGMLLDEPIKLLVKEKDCYKVLEKLASKADKLVNEGLFDAHLRQEALRVTMKKVRIRKDRTVYVKCIIESSMKAVGLAA